MKSTGMVRRIDDLGRIVIPKEIRTNLRIKSGENLEIFLNDEEILLKKYSQLETLSDIASKYVDAIYKTIKKNIIITDKDKIILIEGPLKNKYQNKSISQYIDNLLNRRIQVVEKNKNLVKIIENIDEMCTFSFCPITLQGDVVGSVIILSNDVSLSEVEEKLTIILSKLLSEYFSV